MREEVHGRRELQVDFVSDLTCPWCAIGLAGLEAAIARLQPTVRVTLRLQPFELNPDIPPEGEDVAHYAARKHGASVDELAARQRIVRTRAAAAGLHFPPRTRVWNTFDAHRLLHWAAPAERQLALKRELLEAYHVRGENPGAHHVLLRAARTVGLDVDHARTVLDSDACAAEVRERIAQSLKRGIYAVPAIVVNGHYVVSGAQQAEVIETMLRHIADLPGRREASGASLRLETDRLQ